VGRVSAALLTALALAACGDAGGGTRLAGRATVTDGNTLRVADQAVRLQGVAAPERSGPGRAAATAFVRELVADREVTCDLDGTRTRGRVVGVCRVGDRDIGAEVNRGGPGARLPAPQQGAVRGAGDAGGAAAAAARLLPAAVSGAGLSSSGQQLGTDIDGTDCLRSVRPSQGRSQCPIFENGTVAPPVRCREACGASGRPTTPPSLPDTHPASNLADAHAVSGADADGTVGRT
jgi:endonuclease YncB( thermonuclease family)